MAIVEKNTLFQRKNGTDTEIIYPITKKENIVDLDDNLFPIKTFLVDYNMKYYEGEDENSKNKLQKIIDYINNIANKDIRPIIYVEDDNDSGIFEPYMYYSNSIQSGNTSNKVIRFRSLQPKELEKSPSTVNTKAVGFMVTLGVAEFEIVYSKSSNEVVSVNADNIVTITNSGIDLPMLRTDNTANESDIIDGSNDTLRFTPTYDYQPATKKYVDDNVKTVSDKVTTLESKNVAELDENGKIPASQLPSYVDDVLEFENKAAFPTTGESGKIYVAKDTNLTWRWSGTDYVEISQSIALGETSSTAFRGDYGKLAYTHAVTKKGIEQATKGLYKFKTNTEGHITETEAVTKQDILDLGIEDFVLSKVNTLITLIPTTTVQTISFPSNVTSPDSTSGNMMVFLNGEKLVLGTHFTKVVSSNNVTGISTTSDWNFSSGDIVEVYIPHTVS